MALRSRLHMLVVCDAGMAVLKRIEMSKYTLYEAEILKYKMALEVMLELKDKRMLSHDSLEVIEVLKSCIYKAEHHLNTIVGEDIDAHSCTANAEGGFCAVCGKDVRTAEDFFGPCELGTCTCCR